MARRIVYLIVPESKVYHTQRDCRALNNRDRYWPINKGTIQRDGSIKVNKLLGKPVTGRRPCKVCSPQP